MCRAASDLACFERDHGEILRLLFRERKVPRNVEAKMHGSERIVDFLSGGLSGLISDFLTHPVDTVRTRLWMQGSANAQGYRYRGLHHGFVEIVNREGVRSLFKGFGSVALLTPMAYGLYFGSYEWSKETLHAHTRWSDGTVHFVSGFIANSVGDFAWNPMDVVKQREQAVVGRRFSGPIRGLLAVWREGGVRNGLLRGYFSNMATYGPFSAIYFYVYEHWKMECARATMVSVDDLQMGHHVAGGLVAGAMAAAATSPIDLIKTRIQVDRTYGGIVNTACRIWREEGWRAMTRGVWARVLWIAPGTAITMAVYEDCKRVLTAVTDPAALHSAEKRAESVPL